MTVFPVATFDHFKVQGGGVTFFNIKFTRKTGGVKKNQEKKGAKYTFEDLLHGFLPKITGFFGRRRNREESITS
ncbi:MAG: hypothetical protein HKN57_09090 [Xanthomonadales bacterium]|nr:hypothetical protein [Xanthomonadales bacterium]